MRAAQTGRAIWLNEGRSGLSTNAGISLDMGRGSDHEFFQISARVTTLRAAVGTCSGLHGAPMDANRLDMRLLGVSSRKERR
jgi:hypothetical protein